ncbi:MAG: ribokinase [Chloroflexi bacterium]|uniref:PfkB family carbohydrate kinase n=1 Tax=Candidatus Chlorohelix allophototropha TaxID=3003348 RepID=A0A8T7M5X3_9CHLR|nr:ribokinase [Chloroflexota bacterium]WJW69294.1 PfkB family carbohydrate kinase [Chloroflexota bacterium L227-S17]
MRPSLFFLTIGHIAEDLLPDGSITPGGTVSFAALTARNLGERAAILTVSPDHLRHLDLFHDIEIRGRISEISTRFENIYTPQGRIQYLRGRAPIIDIADVPEEWKQQADIVHIGPIAQECGAELATIFKHALIGITPQGWMRAWDSSDNRVRPVAWEKAEEILKYSGALVLSEEDLPRNDEGERLLQSYIDRCPVVAFTRGSHGCTVYWEGQSFDSPAYPAREVDPTGAGDVFAAAFFIKLRETGSPPEAAHFANAAASINIERPGLSGAPSLAEVLHRLTNPTR